MSIESDRNFIFFIILTIFSKNIGKLKYNISNFIKIYIVLTRYSNKYLLV